MSLTERQRQSLSSIQDRLLAHALDDEIECCATCEVVVANRVLEDEGWGVSLDSDNGYCHELDCIVPLRHAACERWRLG